MGGVRSDPFQVGEDSEHWHLNEDNPYVQRMAQQDDEDCARLGKVGNMSDRMSSEILFWRVVCSGGFSLREVDRWTLDEMRLAAGFNRMQSDYKRLWNTFYDVNREEDSIIHG